MLDPRLFSPEAVDPETAKLNEMVEKLLAAEPVFTEVPPARIRAAREEGKGIWGPVATVDAATTRRLPGPAGEIPARVLV